MTDNEIIKALECCGRESCNGCPYRNGKCHQGNPMIRDALALINRQKAELDDLREIVFMDRSEAIKQLRADAVKEFATRVRNYIKTNCNPYGKPTLDYETSIAIMHYIDNLVKEFTGEEENG